MQKREKNIFSKFLSEAKLKHMDRYCYPEEQILKNTKQKAIVICSIHGEFKQNYDSHVRSGNGCPLCKFKLISDNLKVFYGKHKKNTKDNYQYWKKNYIELMNDLSIANNNKYSYEEQDLMNVKNSDSMIKIHCKTHGLFTKKIIRHMNGIGCSLCDIESARIKSAENFILNSKKIFGDTFGYDRVNYISNKIKVELECKKHGYFYVRPDNHIGLKHGCPVCKASKGEVKIFELLKLLNLEFQREFKIGNHNYRYDFFIPELNMIVEYDGKHHFEESSFFSREENKSSSKTWKEKRLENLARIQERDELKREIALINGFNFIRLNYLEFDKISENLLLQINKYFKYYYNGIFFKGFLDLCINNNFDKKTTLKDCARYCSLAYLKNKLNNKQN